MAYTKKDWVSGELITEAALNNMENGIKNNDTAITAHAGDIATVETTNRASRAYSIGEFLLYNNRLYIVTAAIASGGTITVGTNVSATSAGDQLETLNDNINSLQGKVFAGNVAAGTDVDTVVSVGIHNLPYSSGGYPHAPEDKKYGILLVLKGYPSDVTIGSIAYQVWLMIDCFYVRAMGASGWNDWYKYSGTKLT